MADRAAPIEAVLAPLRTETQPPLEELSTAPVLDSWDYFYSPTNPPEVAVIGKVAGSPKFVDRAEICTSALQIIDSRDMPCWVRTRNTLYRLGWLDNPLPPILQVASRPTWSDALMFASMNTGEHTLPPDLHGDYGLLRIESMNANPDWDFRHALAAKIAKALVFTGRIDTAEAWFLLATSSGSPKGAYGLLLAADVHMTPESEVILSGWKSLSRGPILDDDPIAAAHRLGEASVPSADNTSEESSPEGVLVLGSVGGTQKTSSGKEAAAEFKAVLGRRLPLTAATDVQRARAILRAEFPHLEQQINILLTGLAEGKPIRLSPTLLVGEPGGGKSRLARRFAETLNLPIHRFDASGSADNTFAGTSRRWSSGEHCVPLEAIVRHEIANPLLFVDEIDKAGASSNNGALCKALLPFLEAETARTYPDPYVQAEVNVSGINYILTANNELGLPGPLRDRLRIIRLPMPTIDHLPALARSIVTDLAKKSGDDPRWWPFLGDGELAVAEGLWAGGSVRRLQMIVERLLENRQSRLKN